MGGMVSVPAGGVSSWALDAVDRNRVRARKKKVIRYNGFRDMWLINVQNKAMTAKTVKIVSVLL
ncbi:MAG: hypothetical protein DI535_05465 [Citrobacter freundii]|nr:MAG: hypothetical protein DI535_05465 [Citrobacter freundii]